MSEIGVLLGNENKDALDAMFEGFAHAANDASIGNLHDIVDDNVEVMNNKASKYNKANNVAYEWMKKNANSPTFKAQIVENTLAKMKADLAQSIAIAEDSISSAERTKKFLTHLGGVSGALGVVITAEEITAAAVAGDTREIARLTTKALTVSAASYLTGAISTAVAATIIGFASASIAAALVAAIIPVIAVGLVAYLVDKSFDNVTQPGGQYASYFDGFSSPSTIMQATFGSTQNAVEFTRDLMVKNAGFSYDGVNELAEKNIDFDRIQSAAIDFSSTDGKTMGNEKNDVIEGTDILLDKLYGEDGNDYLIGRKGFDLLDGGNGNDICNHSAPLTQK
jgi:hypothetical protein